MSEKYNVHNYISFEVKDIQHIELLLQDIKHINKSCKATALIVDDIISHLNVDELPF